MVSAAVAAPVVNFDAVTELVHPPDSRPRPSLTLTVPSWAVREPAATDAEPRLTVVLGTVMLIAPPVRVKVVVVVPVVAALARPGRATSSRVAPTRAVRPVRSVFIEVPFWWVVKRRMLRIPSAARAGTPSCEPVSFFIGLPPLSKFCLCLPYVSDVISSRNMANRQCLYAGHRASMGGPQRPVRSLRMVMGT